MPIMNVLGTPCAFVSQHLGLRHRYVYTKNNRLRLRYVAGITAFMAAGLPTAIAFAPLSSVIPVQFEIASAAQAYNYIEPSVGVSRDEQDDKDMLESSEHGQLSLASIPQFEAPANPSDRTVTISQGDALGKVIQREGVGSSEVHEIITAMSKHFNPRNLRVGQDIQMHFEPGSEQGSYQLTDLKIEINPLKTVSVKRDGDNFKAAIEEKEVKEVTQAHKAVIQTSLYGSAAKAGIPQSVVADAIRIFSQNIDFQRDVQPGDAMEVMYDRHETEDGYVAKTGNIRYAKMTLSGREISLYRYEMEDGAIGYFGPNGESTKKTLMKTPVDGARMSSGYGMRRHPVLGYGKMHKGIDFAAPTGTPIYAAGDGVVERANRFGAYGNYVKIRHRSDLHTAYAHLSKITAKAGSRVKQGEVIGYVGTTGRSTGPHLHYEVLVSNKHVNPRSINLPVGHALAGRDLKKFKDHVKTVNNKYAGMTGGSVKVAQRSSKKSDSLN
jgi:murein DD-endopeptidase MepM/ murein hydrolase activator NlpD